MRGRTAFSENCEQPMLEDAFGFPSLASDLIESATSVRIGSNVQRSSTNRQLLESARLHRQRQLVSSPKFNVSFGCFWNCRAACGNRGAVSPAPRATSRQNADQDGALAA